MLSFEEWDHRLRSNCGHYYSVPGDAPAGLFRMHARSGVDVAEIACSVDRIERTRHGIRRDDAEYVFLLHQQAGTTRVTHLGRQEILEAGESLLLDSVAPADLDFAGAPTQFLSAHIPRALCLESQPRMLATGRKIGAGHPLSASFRTLLGPAPAAGEGAYSPDFLIDLLGLAFAATDPSPDATRIRDRHHRYGYVRSVIDRNLTNPALTLDWLAAEVHMSRRQLQREFRDNGTSFSHYLQTRRLKYVAERLRQAARLQQRPAIAELAYRAGFGDLSHFNHLFRRRYGTSPRGFLAETMRRVRGR